MGRIALAAAALALTLGVLPAVAEVAHPNRAAPTTDLSAQNRRPPPRLRVYPPRGRLLYRDCDFRLVQQRRPSGAVIVPWQHCWWVRG
jgi:hypothetical protein